MLAGELQKQKLLFAIGDCAALTLALTLAVLLHDPNESIRSRLLNADPTAVIVVGLAIGVLWVLVFRGADLYRLRDGGMREAIAILNACFLGTLLSFVVLFLAHIHDLSRITVVLGSVLSVPSVLLIRGVLRSGLRRWYASPRVTIPVVIFGFNPIAHYLLDQFLDGMTHYEPVGFLDIGAASGRQYRGYPLLGGPERLNEIAQAWPTLKAAIAMPDTPREEQEHIVELCERNRVRWSTVPWQLRSPKTSLRVDQLGRVLLLGPSRSNILGLNFLVKRTIDVIAASLLLLLSAPIIGLAAALIWLTDGSPVFFRQSRIGVGGYSFQLVKLRTMHRDATDTVHREYVRQWIAESGANPNGHSGGSEVKSSKIFKITNDCRVTRIGKLLRRFSIDELPQLINVVRGEMSLIGPRPALPYELELYTDWHRNRLEAVPGITGLWQVSGRNQLSFDEMVQLDLEYLENWSLFGDVKILMRTLPVLVRGSGV